MNKKFIYLLALVFSLGLTFTACSDDDDDDTPTDYAKEVQGTYKGTVNVKIGDDPAEDVPNQNIKIERTADNKIKLMIENFTLGTIEAGTITVDDVALTESNGTVKLGDKSKNVSLEIAEGATADVAISSSSIKDKTLTLNIKVNNVKAGETVLIPDDIIVTFSGTKQ